MLEHRVVSLVGLLTLLMTASTAAAVPDVQADLASDLQVPDLGLSLQTSASAGAQTSTAMSFDLPAAWPDTPGLALDHVTFPANTLEVTSTGLQARAANQIRSNEPASDASASASGSAAASLIAAIPEEVREVAPPALAAAGVFALLQAFGAFRFAGLGVFALYSRLSKSELLDNEHRDKVHQLIQASPGVAVSEVCEKIGVGWGTAVYHLERLEKAGFVASERAGLRRCYFPVGTVARTQRALIGALKTESTRTLARFLVERPGASQTEVCEALGLSASAASKQVSKLESAGLVRRERDWKTVHLYPEPTLPEILGAEGIAAAMQTTRQATV